MPESALKRRALAIIRKATKAAMGLSHGLADSIVEQYVSKISRLFFNKASNTEVAQLYVGNLLAWMTSDYISSFLDKPDVDKAAAIPVLAPGPVIAKYNSTRAFD